jgi:hypothetical protein
MAKLEWHKSEPVPSISRAIRRRSKCSRYTIVRHPGGWYTLHGAIRAPNFDRLCDAKDYAQAHADGRHAR